MIFNDISAIKTKYVSGHYDFFRMISKIDSKRRYSCYKDEYQVRDMIPISKIVGIKIPEKEFDSRDNNLNTEIQDRVIDYFLNVLKEYNFDISFIDVSFFKEISFDYIKQYRKER